MWPLSSSHKRSSSKMSHSGQSDDDSGHLNVTVMTPTDESITLPSRNYQPPPTLATGESNAPPPEASCGSTILPDELLIEILLRVPLKFLLQFRCVSKSWKSLLSDHHFVRKHRQRANYRLMLSTLFVSQAESQFRFNIDGVITCSVQSLLSNRSISVDSPYRISIEFRVVGSCHGLLCLASRTNESRFVRLWNPSTRWISEPLLLDWGVKYMPEILFGFGYDRLSDNYKLVTVFWHSQAPETVVQVYTLGSNHWRQIQGFPHVPDRYDDGSGKFLCGTLNWLVCRSKVNSLQNVPVDRLVMSLDLGKETFREVLLPDCDNDNDSYVYPNIQVLRDCLCYSYVYERYYFVVWLMKDYGVEESWTKLVTVPFKDLGVPGSIQFPKPLFLSENDEILIGLNYDELILYNSRDNTSKYCEIEGHKRLLRPTIYIESLISPLI